MFRDITSIDLFDQNADMACAKVRLRHIDITGIDLFDQIWMLHVQKAQITWISPVLIYLIKMVV